MMSKIAAFFVLALAAVPARSQSPVVLELYTSEGCSSCPPADDLFSKLVEEPGVIGLAFHVDYWNKLGWIDPYSKAEWSRRQGGWSGALAAESIYTPQLIAGGVKECVGNDEEKVRAAIADARKAAQPAKVTLSVAKPAGGKLAVSVKYDISGSVDSPKLTVALFEDGLVTEVKSGENAGSTMAHTRVVRALEQPPVQDHEAKIELVLDAKWNAAKLGVAAFVSDSKMRVLGAASARP